MGAASSLWVPAILEQCVCVWQWEQDIAKSRSLMKSESARCSIKNREGSWFPCVCLCPFAFLHVNLITEMQRRDTAGKQERELEGMRKKRSEKRVFWCEYKKKRQSLLGRYHDNGDISDEEVFCVCLGSTLERTDLGLHLCTCVRTSGTFLQVWIVLWKRSSGQTQGSVGSWLPSVARQQQPWQHAEAWSGVAKWKYRVGWDFLGSVQMGRNIKLV